MADIWTPIKYGWSHVYWLTVEGVPYVWSQAQTSKTLPAGYAAEVPALPIAYAEGELGERSRILSTLASWLQNLRRGVA